VLFALPSVQRTKVRVVLRLARSEALLVVEAKELVEEVNGLVRDETLVVRRREAVPVFPRVAATALTR
jgi:hypothetical protein